METHWMAISKIKIEGDVQWRLPIEELFLEASPYFDYFSGDNILWIR